MKRLLRCLPLAFFCHGASAQLDMVGRNEDLRLFIDRTVLQREGDVATVWQLVDYTSAQWVGASVVMSVRHLVEYDCRARRTRTLAGAAYSEQMGRGRQVFSEKAQNPEWVAVPVGGSGETLWKIACGAP
ncbi:MAG: hypothetical protein HYU78_07315 [Rhodocyclales bacterium]|nr:hypothetical protein [Rhodocyclales bacterium]